MKKLKSEKNKCVFLDRDGVINELIKRPDERYTCPWSVGEFKFLPKVLEYVPKIKELQYLIIIVTNQPGVSDGEMSQQNLDDINLFLKQNLNYDDIFCCQHKDSIYYKPSNAMLEMLIEKHSIDRSKSYFIGDRWKDIVPGHNSKLTTMFVGSDYISPEKYDYIGPDYTVKNLKEAYKIIKKRNGVV